MKINIKTHLNLRVKEAIKEVDKASKNALKDVTIDIANTVIKVHPWKNVTGNNSRSIKYDIKGLESSIYSTSGYGGYLETGTSKMPARPYFKPALDRHIGDLPKGIKAHLK